MMNKMHEYKLASRTERTVYSEDLMAERFNSCIEMEDKASPKRKSKIKAIRKKLKSCKCSPKATFLSLFPIISWLPQYNFRGDFMTDLTGGLTMGVFHVPQGKIAVDNFFICWEEMCSSYSNCIV